MSCMLSTGGTGEPWPGGEQVCGERGTGQPSSNIQERCVGGTLRRASVIWPPGGAMQLAQRRPRPPSSRAPVATMQRKGLPGCQSPKLGPAG